MKISNANQFIISLMAVQGNTKMPKKKYIIKYEDAKIVPGTWSFPKFVPLSHLCIGAKRTSTDDNFALKFDFHSVLKEPL